MIGYGELQEAHPTPKYESGKRVSTLLFFSTYTHMRRLKRA
jgi:hypothetical protein